MLMKSVGLASVVTSHRSRKHIRLLAACCCTVLQENAMAVDAFTPKLYGRAKRVLVTNARASVKELDVAAMD